MDWKEDRRGRCVGSEYMGRFFVYLRHRRETDFRGIGNFGTPHATTPFLYQKARHIPG